MMPCTIIRHGDMADRILDRNRHPEWRGEKTRLVYSWPDNAKLWEQYAEIWAGDLRNNGTGQAATDFYAEHRDEMDKGSDVSWPARFEQSELSAIQHAWNLKLRVGEEAFNAEYQNEPDDVASNTRPITLTSDDLTGKANKVKQGVVPAEYNRLTAFIDISQKVLWWTVVAFDDHFGGAVIDYGAWPDQRQRYYKLQTLQKTLQRKYKGHGLEAAILNGLEDLSAHLTRTWPGETGLEHQVERLLIDEGDGEHTQIVRNFCRRSELAAIVWPAKGRGIKASSKQLCEGQPRPGERFGQHWKLVRNRDGSRTVHTDVNYWKTFSMRRFEVPHGDAGALSLFKASPRQHQMFADQITAEYCKEIEDIATGNRVIEWHNSKNRDNHFFDCLVGCCVGASVVGCSLTAQQPVEPPQRKRRKVRYL
jgi:phage terminase large subunit GpA-like protein